MCNAEDHGNINYTTSNSLEKKHIIIGHTELTKNRLIIGCE